MNSLTLKEFCKFKRFWCYAAKNLKVKYYIKGKQF
jgi:hypothetical protein